MKTEIPSIQVRYDKKHNYMIHTSSYWKNHFQTNLAEKRIDWNVIPSITDGEKKSILYSLRAWQLGETGDGNNLLAAAKKYADTAEDDEYVQALELFILEEQKHGGNLGRYLDLIGEKRLKKDWGDTLFRAMRHFNTSIEAWTITVIIVEGAAQIFYKALHDATQCTLLKAICNDILIDEAHHMKFQNERLYSIFQKKNFYSRAISFAFYSGLFLATVHAIWWGHLKAFIAGNVSRKNFLDQMSWKFFQTMQFIHAPHKEALSDLGYA